MKNKKLQASLEFFIIFMILLLFSFFLLKYFSVFSMELEKKKQESDLEDFVNSIFTEIDLISNVNGGYIRELKIPKYIYKKYNVKIINDYIVINQTNNGMIYFYQIPQGVNISIFINRTTNDTKLIFKKEFNEDYNGIVLS